MRWILCFTVCLSVCTGAAATDPVSFDHPDITEPAAVIPRGRMQMDNEAAWIVDKGSQAVDVSQSLIRIGLGGGTELRLGVPGFSAGMFGSRAASGFGDVELGFKQRLHTPWRGAEISAVVALSFPTGRGGVSSGGYDPSLRLLWSRELSRGWSVSGQQSVYWNTDADDRNRVWEPGICLSKQVTRLANVYTEYAAGLPERGSPQHLLLLGVAYEVREVNLIDVHYGFGLNAATAGQFLSIGYSFRLGRIWR